MRRGRAIQYIKLEKVSRNRKLKHFWPDIRYFKRIYKLRKRSEGINSTTTKQIFISTFFTYISLLAELCKYSASGNGKGEYLLLTYFSL